MALSRSASGPGGLSINTSTANMFNAGSSQPPAPAGLFGAASQTSTTPKPAGLFGNASSTATSQPQQTSSLFGTPTSQPQQSGGGLFGNVTTATQPQASGGLFGSANANTNTMNNTTTSQPQQTGGLFGSASQNQSQPTQTGGLFGNLQNQTQNRPTGSLFGSAGQTAPTATGGTGGPFGNLLNPSQPASNMSTMQRSSPFGSLNQQPQQNQPSAFGQSQQRPGIGLGGSMGFGLTMGQSTTQQTVPGVRIDFSNLKGTTRFNDLQEDTQKGIEKVDNFIQQQIKHKEEVDSFLGGHGEMLENLPNDVKFVERKYDGARNALESAAQAIEVARLLVRQDADSARLSFRAIDNQKLPQQYQSSGIWSPRQQAAGTANNETDGQDLVGFFSKAGDDMEDQMRRYGKNLTEIETHMHGVSDGLAEQLQRMMATKNGAPAGSDEKIQELVAVLRDFEQGILKVAGDVGSAREGMTRLQLGDFLDDTSDRNGVY